MQVAPAAKTQSRPKHSRSQNTVAAIDYSRRFDKLQTA